MRRLVLTICMILPILASCDKKEKTPKIPDVCAGITDTNFKNFCYSMYDTDGDGIVSKEEAEKVTSMNINDKSVTSLVGISAFPNIKQVAIKETSIQSLDLSKNSAIENLKIEDCTYMTSLNISNLSGIKTLTVTGTKISTLDVSKLSDLQHLECQKNGLTALDVKSNTALTYLDCSLNSISSLDISKNTSLKHLECFMPTLKELTIALSMYIDPYFQEVLKQLETQLPGLKINGTN